MGRIRTHATVSRDPLTMVPGGPHMPWPPEEGYSADARDALAAAQTEASRLGHNHVSPPHIFVGVAVTQTSGVAGEVLRGLGITAASARAAIEARMKSPGDPFPIDDITLTPLGQNVIERARHEAVRMHHREARAEHLLIASAHWKDGFVDPILSSLDTTPEALKAAVTAMLDLPPSYGVAENADATDGPYESFDRDAWDMLQSAAHEATSAGHFGISGHDFLLGLAALAESGESGAAVRVLDALEITTADIRAQFAAFPAWRSPVERDTVSLSAAAKLVIEHAIQLAEGGGVRLEHLLVAMHDGDTMARHIFARLGVKPERLRALLLR